MISGRHRHPVTQAVVSVAACKQNGGCPESLGEEMGTGRCQGCIGDGMRVIPGSTVHVEKGQVIGWNANMREPLWSPGHHGRYWKPVDTP